MGIRYFMMLTPRSLQNPSPAVFTWHAAHTLRRSASSVISLNMSFPWDTILLLILMCLLTPCKILHFPSFTLHMAFIQQNLCFADFTFYMALILHSLAFVVFTFHVICTLQNHFSSSLYCVWSYIIKSCFCCFKIALCTHLVESCFCYFCIVCGSPCRILFLLFFMIQSIQQVPQTKVIRMRIKGDWRLMCIQKLSFNYFALTLQNNLTGA